MAKAFLYDSKRDPIDRVPYTIKVNNGKLDPEEHAQIKGKLTDGKYKGKVVAFVKLRNEKDGKGKLLPFAAAKKAANPPKTPPGKSPAARYAGTATAVYNGQTITAKYQSKSPGTVDGTDKKLAKRAIAKKLKGKKIKDKIEIKINEPAGEKPDKTTFQASEGKTDITSKQVKALTKRSLKQLERNEVSTTTEPTELPEESKVLIRVPTGKKGKKKKVQYQDYRFSYSRSADPKEDARNLVGSFDNVFGMPGKKTEGRRNLMNADVEIDGKKGDTFGVIYARTPGQQALDKILDMPEWEDTGISEVDALMRKARDIDRLIAILMASLADGNLDVIAQVLGLIGMKTNITVANMAKMVGEALIVLNNEREEVSNELAELYKKGDAIDGGDAEDDEEEGDGSKAGALQAAITKARSTLDQQSSLRELWKNMLIEGNDTRKSVLNAAKSWLDSIARDPMRYIFQ